MLPVWFMFCDDPGKAETTVREWTYKQHKTHENLQHTHTNGLLVTIIKKKKTWLNFKPITMIVLVRGERCLEWFHRVMALQPDACRTTIEDELCRSKGFI